MRPYLSLLCLLVGCGLLSTAKFPTFDPLRIPTNENNILDIVEEVQGSRKQLFNECEQNLSCYAEYEGVRLSAIGKLNMVINVNLEKKKEAQRAFEKLPDGASQFVYEKFQNQEGDVTTRKYRSALLLDIKYKGIGDENEKIIESKRKELSGLIRDAKSTITNDNTSISLKPDELTGCPSRIRDTKSDIKLTKGNTKLLLICLNDSEARRRVYVVNKTRCSENKALWQKILKLRQEIAELLGYPNHLAMRVSKGMAKDVFRVEQFLKEEHERLSQPVDRNLALQPWDVLYVMKGIRKKEKESSIDDTIASVISKVSQILKIKFVEVNVKKWESLVKAFALYNNEKLCGFLYLDLFHRKGKFPRTAHFPVIPRFRKTDDQIVLPVSLIVANFVEGKKISRSDQALLFHEFGHAMHALLSVSDFARFSASNVEKDFVEMPSQLAEKWLVGDKQDLYSRRSQLFLSIYDYEIHTKKDVDHEQVYNQLLDKFGSTISPSITGPNAFGHLLGGYDGFYYGYLWSLRIAEQIWLNPRGFNDGKLDAGERYKKTILMKGSSESAETLIKEFIGNDGKL